MSEHDSWLMGPSHRAANVRTLIGFVALVLVTAASLWASAVMA